ncbi:MAG TPA: hypothetical protein VN600_11245 [Gemmatimonadaceae bacterium]|nr:hypothetical protein [Gemmatimonadaceae bacterium]
MKRLPRLGFERGRRSKGSIALSLAAHAVAIVLIASITFRYPISALFSSSTPPEPAPIHYVNVQPAPRGQGGTGPAAAKPPKKAANPVTLLAPTIIPTTLPPIPPPNLSAAATAGSPNGTGTGAPGIATGVEAALPDSRIELRPKELRVPLSTAARNDSAVKAIFMAYREAEIEAEEHAGRSPRDWTVDHNGQKYGMDSQYIYLGKFKVPSAILAALPLNPYGVNGEQLIQNRNAAWIQNDIYSHAQGMSQEDFDAAVKRIRARKDREKREAQDANGKGAKPASIVP